MVVDNASTDGSAEAASARPGVRLIALPANVGFAAANNAAIRATSGELILLLNSDTIVPARGDRRARRGAPRLARRRPRPGHAWSTPTGGPSCRSATWWRRWRNGGRSGCWRPPPAGAPRALETIDERTRTRRYPDWVSGACLLVRRADAEAVGLLDERYFMYLEDVDFCAALRARGRRILFTPDVTVTHLRGRSRQAAPAATNRAYRDSHRAFYAKHHPRWAPLLDAYLRLKGA